MVSEVKERYRENKSNKHQYHQLSFLRLLLVGPAQIYDRNGKTQERRSTINEVQTNYFFSIGVQPITEELSRRQTKRFLHRNHTKCHVTMSKHS